MVGYSVADDPQKVFGIGRGNRYPTVPKSPGTFLLHHEETLMKSKRRWYQAQLNWHEVRADYYYSFVMIPTGFRERADWHASQARWYWRRLVKCR